MSRQTAVYRGASLAAALQQFTADAQRAASVGYFPTSQSQVEEAGEFVLTVEYERADAPVAAPMAQPLTSTSSTTPTVAVAVDSVAPRGRVSRRTVAIAVVTLVLLGGVAGAAGNQSPKTTGAVLGATPNPTSQQASTPTDAAPTFAAAADPTTEPTPEPTVAATTVPTAKPTAARATAKPATFAQLKAGAKKLSYKDLFRNHARHVGDSVYFKGEVIQVLGDEDAGFEMRVNVTRGSYGFWDDTVYLSYTGSRRVLEDDIIQFVGVSMDLITYESTMGADITIPHILVTRLVID
jgi:hypothetical protein